jgi:hypothetical protein
MPARGWLRAGLTLLAAQGLLVGAWAYLAPRSFYTDLSTISTDPPFNEHFVSDIGGLNLALAVVVAFAVYHLEYRQVRAALAAFLTFAATHLLLHMTHLSRVTTTEAIMLVFSLSVDVAIPVALLVLARRPGAGTPPQGANTGGQCGRSAQTQRVGNGPLRPEPRPP